MKGTGAVSCACKNHKDRCIFGRPHVWGSPWYREGALLDTEHCLTCDSECTGLPPTQSKTAARAATPARCACGEDLEPINGSPAPYWYHSESGSLWCES